MPRQAEELAVCVEAEVADGSKNVWTRCLALGEPLADLVQRWAEDHGVPVEAVACADISGCPLDLRHAPAALGWSGKDKVHIMAYPVDIAYAEVLAEPSVASGPAGEREPSPCVAPGSAPAPPAPARGRGRRPAPVADVAPSSTPAKATRKAAAADAPAGAPAEKAFAAGAEPCGRGAKRYKDFDGSDPPKGETPVVYLQDNPKQRGSAGWERYEKYKFAKTPTEALALGSAKGDLVHDWRKGYYRLA